MYLQKNDFQQKNCRENKINTEAGGKSKREKSIWQVLHSLTIAVLKKIK